MQKELSGTYKDIQLRLDYTEFWMNPTFRFRGIDIFVLGRSSKTDLIPNKALGLAYHEVGQYTATTANRKSCEVYMYSYRDFYGKKYLVVDTIKFI